MYVLHCSISSTASRGEILGAVRHRLPGKSMDEIREMDKKLWQEYSNRTKRRALAHMWMKQHSAVLHECEQLLAESEEEAIQHAVFSAEVLRLHYSSFHR